MAALTTDIKKAVNILNEKLTASRVIDSRLLFVSIDEISDQYKNDKNVINAINYLVDESTRNNRLASVSNEALLKRDKRIESLEKDIASLNNDLKRERVERENEAAAALVVREKFFVLEKRLKEQGKDIAKLKSYISTFSSQQSVAERKSKLEIELLKQALLMKRDLPVSAKYITGSIIGNSPVLDNHGQVITINNDLGLERGSDAPFPNSVLDDYANQAIDNLTNIIKSSSTQNYKYIKFIEGLNEFIDDVNLALQNDTLSNISPFEFQPPIEADLNSITLFEEVIAPLQTNIYQLSKSLDGLGHGDGEKIQDLQQRLDAMTDRWKEALEMGEEWKRYKLNTDAPKSKR